MMPISTKISTPPHQSATARVSRSTTASTLVVHRDIGRPDIGNAALLEFGEHLLDRRLGGIEQRLAHLRRELDELDAVAFLRQLERRLLPVVEDLGGLERQRLAGELVERRLLRGGECRVA